MGAATKEAGETRIKAFGLNEQGKTEPDLLFIQLLETTRTESTASRKVELNLNTEKLEYRQVPLFCKSTSFSTATLQIQAFQPLQI